MNFNIPILSATIEESVGTNGLIYHLDAGNPKSFFTGSKNWQDLTGNYTTNIFISGSSYTSSYYGGINFTGSNYVSTSVKLPVNNFSICMWFQTKNSGYWSTLWGCENWTSATGYVAYLSNVSTLTFSKGGGIAAISAVVSNATNPNFYSFTYDNANNAKIYINGTLISSGTLASSSVFTNTLLINSRYQNSGIPATDSFPSIINMFSVYNRALDQSDITQYYNATKSRFS
jgi:hypothetical protein